MLFLGNATISTSLLTVVTPITLPNHPSQPGRQSNGRIRKIDLPEANNGTILLESGSTINVSGTSKFYTIKSKLDCPLTISLVISTYVAPVEYIGTLRIPMPTGLMEINDVYFCNRIKGSILLTGHLLKLADLYNTKVYPQPWWIRVAVNLTVTHRIIAGL
ncbi:uncharacterized protein VP01_3915g2 [Puccinia sorghi]|uniref:Uncharacterized protein n=1 Tax=Puccinia sorghi TaxID=27349 RepID=A0A0L6USP4_9BASI|nr:uncharacterized protein VP01_3915g2 [Puccinia sorghi]